MCLKLIILLKFFSPRSNFTSYINKKFKKMGSKMAKEFLTDESVEAEISRFKQSGDIQPAKEARGTEQTLQEIKEKLTAIESLLQQLPVIQAVTFIQLNEEYQLARLRGETSKDLWDLNIPEFKQ